MQYSQKICDRNDIYNYDVYVDEFWSKILWNTNHTGQNKLLCLW